MNRGAIIAGLFAALLAVPALSQSSQQTASALQPPPHTLPYPDLASGETEAERGLAADDAVAAPVIFIGRKKVHRAALAA